jgi:hypothetical protein
MSKHGKESVSSVPVLVVPKKASDDRDASSLKIEGEVVSIVASLYQSEAFFKKVY